MSHVFDFSLQPRTQTLLNALISEQADSREALLEAWRRDNKCKCTPVVDLCIVGQGALECWCCTHAQPEKMRQKGCFLPAKDDS